MNETIDLNLIRAFTTVAEAGGFTRAAERLGVPRATVSRRVAHLERELGVRLFQRTTRRVSLSTAGAALHTRVVAPLTAIEEAVQGLPEVDDHPAGRLRITAPADLATAVLPEIIASFVRDHPAVSVDLCVTNTFVDLVAGGFDCALRISSRQLRDSSLVARRIGELPMHLYASKTYLRAHPKPIRPRDVAKHDGVVFRPLYPLRLHRKGRQARVELHGRVETDDTLFVHRALLGDMGIGLLPAFLAADDVAAGRLERVLPRWEAKSGQLWMVWPGGPYVPQKTRRFYEALLEAFG